MGEKVLGGRPEEKLSEPQVLGMCSLNSFSLLWPHHAAILSIRLPLDFTSMTMQGRAEGFSQVRKHKHMCLCIDVCSDLQVCDTVQPAEPLLSRLPLTLPNTTNLTMLPSCWKSYKDWTWTMGIKESSSPCSLYCWLETRWWIKHIIYNHMKSIMWSSLIPWINSWTQTGIQRSMMPNHTNSRWVMITNPSTKHSKMPLCTLCW